LTRKRIIILVSIAAVLGAGVFLLASKRAPKVAMAEQAKPSLTVTTESPDTRNWPQSLTASGNIQASQEAVIGAEVSGLRLA